MYSSSNSDTCRYTSVKFMMSILSLVSGKKKALSNPMGSLSHKISPAVIVSANAEVAKVLQRVNNGGSISSTRRKPRIYSQAE